MSSWRLPPDGLPVPDPPLGDDSGLVLRPWAARDAPALATAWVDAEIARRLPVPDDPTADRASQWLAGGRARRQHVQRQRRGIYGGVLVLRLTRNFYFEN